MTPEPDDGAMPDMGSLLGMAMDMQQQLLAAQEQAAAAVVEEVRPERILHLAGQSSVHLSWLDPGGTMRTNVLGIVHLLDAVRRQGLRPAVLVVGSAEEYGAVAPAEMPIREETPLRPASPYAVSKVAQGALALPPPSA